MFKKSEVTIPYPQAQGSLHARIHNLYLQVEKNRDAERVEREANRYGRKYFKKSFFRSRKNPNHYKSPDYWESLKRHTQELEEEWGRFGSKVSLEQIINFLGPPPQWEDLPEWITGEKRDEDKERKNEERLEGLFSQIPHDLLCNPEIPMAARLLFCVYHKFCPEKNLKKRPRTFVGRKKVAAILGISLVYLWELNRCLANWGWIEVIPRKGRSNITILNPWPIIRGEDNDLPRTH